MVGTEEEKKMRVKKFELEGGPPAITRAQPGEVRPAPLFQRDQAPGNEPNDEGGIGMHVQVAGRPRGEGHDDSGHFSNVVSKRDTTERRRTVDEGVSGPGGPSGAGLQTVVDSRTVSPDVNDAHRGRGGGGDRAGK